MDQPAHVVQLELWFDGDSPTGRAIAHGEPQRRFTGWLGLVAAVEALVEGGHQSSLGSPRLPEGADR